ncbi:uncharacterized protein [Haliotis cracherodii]|uniref:uncharacterized protein n=1 Tax=Haliotis cracherodii TaxID=6455 RepID=UPI0039E7CADF
MDHADLKETVEKERTEKQNEDNEAPVSTKDNEEPNTLTGVRQKKSDDNLKKKLPEDDTDQKAVEDVAEKFAGLAVDTDSLSTLQATPPSPDRVPAVSPQDSVPIVPNALVVNARSLRKNKSILQRRLDDDLNWARVILVSETWYKDKHTEIERSINRYNGFFEDRKKDVTGKGRAGGAAIYLSAADCSVANYVYTESSPHSEAIGVTFVFRDVVWLAVCIYSVNTSEADKEERTNWNNKFIQWVLAREGAKDIDLEQTIIVGGDLNHSEVTLPGFTNYVRTRTLRREGAADTEHIIDLLYTNHARGWDSVNTLEDEETHEQISDHFIVRAFSQDI